MSAAIDYDKLARIHRPSDPAVLPLEIRRLRQNGLTARDIAAALRLDLGQVLEALVGPTSPAPPAVAEPLGVGHSAVGGGGRSFSNITKGQLP